MNLQESTPTQVPGVSAMYVGRAEPREVARFFTEPYAALNEAGLNVAEGTPVRIQANQELRPDIREAIVVIIIIIGDDGSVTVIVVNTHTLT
jgi:hypothetical protein